MAAFSQVMIHLGAWDKQSASPGRPRWFLHRPR